MQIEDVCLARTHRPGREVYFLTRGEVAYLADLDRGRFYGLDAVGAEMVALLLGRGESAAVERIAREYNVDEGRVRSDLDALLGNLGRRGLLVPVGGGAGRAGSRLSRLGWGMLRRLAAVALQGLGPRSGRESEVHPAEPGGGRAVARAGVGEPPAPGLRRERRAVAGRAAAARGDHPAEA